MTAPGMETPGSQAPGLDRSNPQGAPLASAAGASVRLPAEGPTFGQWRRSSWTAACLQHEATLTSTLRALLLLYQQSSASEARAAEFLSGIVRLQEELREAERRYASFLERGH
jgi:hypothetical protein